MFELDFADVNWLAVMTATVAAFFVGALFYGMLFGKTWVKLHKYTEEQVKEAGSKQLRTFGFFFIGDFVTATTFALLFLNLPEPNTSSALMLAALLWFGFVATTHLIHNAAHLKPPAAYAIDASYHLCSLLAMGAIIGTWR